MQTAKKARQDKTRKMMDDGCYDGVLNANFAGCGVPQTNPLCFCSPREKIRTKTRSQSEARGNLKAR